MSGRLSPEEHAALAELASILLPGTDAAARFEQVLALRADILPDLRRALRIGGDLDAIAERDTEAYAALRLLVLGAHYTDPAVLAALGYPGQKSRPVRADEVPDFIAEDLLAPVIARGAIWRDPDNHNPTTQPTTS